MSRPPRPFRPLAIVGQACILPSAASPRALFDLVHARKCAISDVPAGRFRIDPRLVAGTTTNSVDRTWSTAGGYVRDADFTFTKDGLDVDNEHLQSVDALDPLFHWVLSAGRDALVDAGFDVPLRGVRAGAVLGNLSFPTESMTLLGEQRALSPEVRRKLGAPWSVDVDARNEFMSGLPAHVLARALHLDSDAGAFALDAACASSLYAVKLAAAALDDGRADVMLAGAVNRADALFLHVGFCALQALSATGRSRPFDVDADGLVPAEGCGIVALMRLDDAIAQGKRIHAVIRGVGLSNDGRSRNLLAPSSEGQARAIRLAWDSAGLSMATADYVECHATGTQIGDRTEVETIREVFGGDGGKERERRRGALPLGSLKSNLGHLITAAGVAGLIKVVESMRNETLPPSVGIAKPIVDDATLRIVRAPEPWPSVDGRPRRAGVSAFGFGGNNAHIVVEEHRAPAHVSVAVPSISLDSASAARVREGGAPANPPSTTTNVASPKAPPTTSAPAVDTSTSVKAGAASLAVVAVAQRHGPDAGVALVGLRFPPNDLRDALPQQLLVFEAARDLVRQLGDDVERVLPRERTAVLIGMATDMSVTWPGLRWRAPEIARRLAPTLTSGDDVDRAFLDGIRAAAMPALGAQTVLGCMPNIPANRLNVQLDVRGPGFTISAEELSGIRALDVARGLIASGDVDAAIVGAVDAQPGTAGEAAVLVVMTEERARQLALPVVAVLSTRGRAPLTPQPPLPKTGEGEPEPRGAAAGMCRLIDAIGRSAGDTELVVDVNARGGAQSSVLVRRGSAPVDVAGPALFIAGAPDRASLCAVLRAGDVVDADPVARGPWRAVIVASTAAELASKRASLADQLANGSDDVSVDADGCVAKRAAPLDRGQVALLFGTATSLEPDALSELRKAFPDVDGALSQSVGRARLDAVFARSWRTDAPSLADLATASAHMQLYAGIVRDALHVDYGKVAGVSLGESNAMFAANAWSDVGSMLDDMESSRLFDGKLYPPQRPWKAVVVRAPVAQVRAACSGKPAFILVIHATDEVELGGAPEAVDDVVKAIGASAIALPTMPVVHCDWLSQHSDAYRAFHRRPTRAGDVVVYSHGARGGPGPVKLDADTASDTMADALLAQGCITVDFPKLLAKLVDDGSRLLIDCSPRGLAGAWAKRSVPANVDVIALGSDVTSVFSAAARAITAGARVDVARLRALAIAVRKPASTSATLRVGPRPLPRALPAVPVVVETMTAPPARPRILAVDVVERAPLTPQPPLPKTGEGEPESLAVDAGALAVLDARASALDAHKGALDAMARAHAEFMAHREAAAQRLVALADVEILDGEPDLRLPLSRFWERGLGGEGRAASTRAPDVLWDRSELEVLASGRISDVWGPLFSVQDDFRRQVRMPEPPLLLADRVMSIDAQPGVLEKDRSIVTETDLDESLWYLHENRCPAGILIETGQADLLLVSYMGVDFENRGERVYRLLGCDLTYTAPLPLSGTTLRHDIHVDGYATAPMSSGADTRIFFFHSDTFSRRRGQAPALADDDTEREERVLSVRNGQAGFFTDEELAGSGGILWKPSDVDASALSALPLAAPPSPSTKRSFTRAELDAWSNGDAFACFGFAQCAPHVRTPTIPRGPLQLVDKVTDIDFRGGPWKRGYLRAELALDESAWFLKGHFKDDPCMPGTLMFEGCLSTLAIYLGAAGFTIDRDGFRFEPATNKVFKLRCRGQATPSSRNMVYEIFVRALVDGPEPSVVADILVTVDGLKSLHCEAVELKLACDWPLSSQPALLVDGDGPRAVAPNTTRALLATGIGRPSEAFPGMYEAFDKGRRVPRLPGPPYHFMSRVVDVTGPAMGSLLRNESAAGTEVVVEYDVPPDAWFFDEAARSQAATMPFAILLEIALQPCGWVSSYVGSALTSDSPLSYRNLDGSARLHREVPRDVGTLVTTARLLKSSASSGMIIQELAYAVATKSGEPVFDGTTVFGFFPPEALARQVGIGSTAEERARLAERCAFDVVNVNEIDGSRGRLALPGAMLTMIDRVCAYDGRYVRTEKDIDPGEWFFKAHFFQDPVQPGSLGIEAMVQALQWVAMHEDDAGRAHAHMARPRFEALAVGAPVMWKYRGQVVPANKRVHVELERIEHVDDERGVLWRADGSLWVDGIKIYTAKALSIRVVDDV